MLAYERKEKKLIDEIASKSAKLKKMQTSEIKGIKKHVRKHKEHCK